MTRLSSPNNVNKPLLVLVTALAALLLLPTTRAFIIAARPSAAAAAGAGQQQRQRLAVGLGATASFFSGGGNSGGSDSGNGPLASVPTIESLEELQRVTAATGARPLVLRYHASWCSACKKFAPSWLQTAGAYSGPDGFDFMDVDVTHQRDIITALGLTALPHCHIYRGGQQVENFPVSVKKLNNLLETLEKLKGQQSS